MPRTPVVRDPNHPDFPHATPTGYNRGCACDRCKRAEHRYRKQLRIDRIRTGRSRKTIARDQQQAAVDHVTRLLEQVPTISLQALLSAAGIPPGSQRSIDFRSGMAQVTYDRLMALTVERVRQHAAFVPFEKFEFLARTTQALGYSLRWQSEQTGIAVQSTLAGGVSTVRVDTYARMQALAKRIGDRMATPESTGLTKAAITHSKNAARGQGFYPPIFYDEDGTLDYRAIPDHPWSIVDEEAHRKIALLRAMVYNREGLSHNQIALKVGVSERQPERLVQRYRLGMEERRRPKRIAWLQKQIDRFDRECVDPVTFCLEIELAPPLSFPADHPGRVAWHEANPGWVHPKVAERLAREAAQAELAAEPLPETNEQDGQVAA